MRHHVYSFSKPKRFDLKLYRREDQRTVIFDIAGVVALSCNIHDAMTGFVFVTTTPFAVQSDVNGHVAIPGVPAGTATVRVWHPSIRAPGNSLSQPLSVAVAGRVPFQLTDGRREAVVTVGTDVYRLIVSPIMAPTELGWVVFAVKLNETEMRALEQMAAVPLDAVVLRRDNRNHWRSVGGSIGESAPLDRLVETR